MINQLALISLAPCNQSFSQTELKSQHSNQFQHRPASQTSHSSQCQPASQPGWRPLAGMVVASLRVTGTNSGGGQTMQSTDWALGWRRAGQVQTMPDNTSQWQTILDNAVPRLSPGMEKGWTSPYNARQCNPQTWAWAGGWLGSARQCLTI